MGLDRKIAAHVCNAVRRQIQSRFPHLTPVFVIFDKEGAQAALEKDLKKISKHPCGKTFLDYIKAHERRLSSDRRTRFVGLALQSKGSALSLSPQRQSLCLFFVNLQHYDTEFALKTHAISMIWQAIKIREDYTTRQKMEASGDTVTVNFRNEDTFELRDGVLCPKLSADMSFKRNIGADCFAASLQFMEGQRDAIKNVCALRMQESLLPKDGHAAERFAFGLAHDTLAFVFENASYIRNSKAAALLQALMIADDIGMNYTIPAAEHWRSYCQPAQHMAWTGHPPEMILGAAVYSSENPYVRTIAYLIEEFAGIDPSIVTSFDDFNAFLPREKSAQKHLGGCESALNKVLFDTTIQGGTSPFYEEAQRQFNRLQSGNPHGWCAYALLQLLKEHPQLLTGTQIQTSRTKIEEFFVEKQHETPFDMILKFSVLMFQRRRNSADITLDDMLRMTNASNEFALIGAALKTFLEYEQASQNKKRA